MQGFGSACIQIVQLLEYRKHTVQHSFSCRHARTHTKPGPEIKQPTRKRVIESLGVLSHNFFAPWELTKGSGNHQLHICCISTEEQRNSLEHRGRVTTEKLNKAEGPAMPACSPCVKGKRFCIFQTVPVADDNIFSPRGLSTVQWEF